MCKAPSVRQEDEKELLEAAASSGDGLQSPPSAAVPLRSFFSLVMVYVSPLTYALCTRRLNAQPSENRLDATSSATSWFLWLLVSYCLYFSQRLVAQTRRWKMNDKTASGHKEDVLRMGYLSGLFLYIGRVGARFDTLPLTFSVLLFVFTFSFGFLFDAVKHYDIEFTGACLSNPATLLFAAFVALIVTALAFDHLSILFAQVDDDLNHDKSSRVGSLGVVGLVVAFHFSLAAAPGGKCAAHWHHWYTGALGSLFCPFNTTTSHIAQAMFLGIYLHGAALFGVEPCFSEEDDDNIGCRDGSY